MNCSDWFQLAAAAVCLGLIVVLMLVPSPEQKRRWWMEECQQSRSEILYPFLRRHSVCELTGLRDDVKVLHVELNSVLDVIVIEYREQDSSTQKTFEVRL